MDGNGRWAKERGMPRSEGHRKGVDNLREILRNAYTQGISHLTVYAFSTENWLRPEDEVTLLMNLLASSLKRYTKDLIKQKVRLHTIGRIEALPANVQSEIQKAKAKTAHFEDYHFTLALNYGSRMETLDAVKRYTQALLEGRTSLESLDWEAFRHYLDTADMPDPDLFIRTSGEVRTSNFLLLQSAYSEMIFTRTYWPDFGPEALAEALEEYKRRQRRFGMTSEQVKPSEYGF
jgi:undecaprenyl diphosphate synthase